MRKILTLLFISIMSALIMSGCYTILKHPSTEANYTAHDYQADCLACHPDYHEYPYGYFYGSYPDYWWSTPRWGRYYAYPWWWDNYWYSGGGYHYDDDSEDYSPRSTRGKKVERRDVLRPPYSLGTANIQRSGSRGIDLNTDKSDKSTTDPGGQVDQKQKQEAKEKQETRTKRKSTRRGGGRSR